MSNSTSQDSEKQSGSPESPSLWQSSSPYSGELRFGVRGKLPESPRRRKRPSNLGPEPARVLSETERRQEAAWKQVEETGGPVFLDGTLFMLQGMSLSRAIEFLPEELHDDARKAWGRKFIEIFGMLALSTRSQIREILAEEE